MIAKFHRTDLVIYSHSKEKKTLSYSRINIVYALGVLYFIKGGASKSATAKIILIKSIKVNGYTFR